MTNDATTSFATKYRPILLKDVYGQEAAKKKIKGFLTANRLPTAILLTGPTGTGKAQPLDSLVLTPKGYVKMGTLKIGDFIIDGLGNETRVSGIYPQGIRRTFRINFDDNTSVLCSDEHLWKLEDENGNRSVINTLQIIEEMQKEVKFHIPLVKVKEFDNIEINGMQIGNGIEEREEQLKELTQGARYTLLDEKTNGEAIAFIARTLGYVAKVENKILIIYKENIKRNIESIIEVESQECQCIMVESDDHTYITDNVTVTHNTTLARCIARHVNKVKDANEFNDVFEFNIGTNGTLQDIRDLASKLKFMPRNENHKSIYILDEVHRLDKRSASGLLKELEEPPAHVMFILCTNEPENLLDTLKPRCMNIELVPYTEKNIVDLLSMVCEKESVNIEEKYLARIAQAANYQPRESLVTLQGIANLLAGGGDLTQEQIESEIKNATHEQIYDLAAVLVLALFRNKMEKAIECVHLCENKEALISLSLTAMRFILPYIALSTTKNPITKIPYQYQNIISKLRELFGKTPVGELQTIAAKVHRTLYLIRSDSFRSNINLADVFFNYITEHCCK